MGGKSQTTNSTSSQTYTPRGLEQLQQILQQAFNVSKTPYQPYKGQLVAGFNPEMFKGIQGINRASTAANPYLQQASQYAQQGAAPISSSQISNYENPFQSDVINSTMANINQTNAQQQNQVVGNAALQGALGGDRVKVAQAALAGQQNMSNNQTLAGLNSQNYSQALGAAQQDRSAAGQAAYTFGNLGQEAQNTALQGAGAQLQSGQLEQQEQQNKLTSAYQQFLKQQAFPYQQLQFLAGIGLPTIGAMGGTTEGTSSTTTPGPSPWGQIAGLGLTAAGMFLRDGGRVSPKKYADGGITGGPADYIDITSYVPKPVQLSAGQQHIPGVSYPKAPQQQSSGMPSASQLSGGIGGLKSIFGGMGNASAGPSYGGPIDASTWGGSADNDIGFSHGGFVNSVHAIRKALKARHYDDGGSVPAFDERFVGIVPDKYDIGPSQVLATADPALAPIDNSYIANGTPMVGAPVAVLAKGDRLPPFVPSNPDSQPYALSEIPSKTQDRVPQQFNIADVAGPAGVGPLPVSAGFDGTDNVPLPPARPITGTEAIPGAGSTDYTAPTSGYADNIDRYGKVIGSIESGNSYGALGPVIPKTGDRAYGKYQVMGENVPVWTKEVLGKSLTPEQFLKSPEAQDAVFRAKFGQYVNKYGPEGASRAWFAGEGGMNNLAARDVLGTTVGDYGRRFASALGGDSSTPFNSDALIPRSAQTVQYNPQQNGSSQNGAPQADRGLIGKITDAFGGKSWDQLLFGHSLTPEQRNSLMAAGAGMMASPSHFPLQQIGEGSLQGLNYYQKAQATNQAQQRINLEAQNMARQAQQFAQEFGLKKEQFGVQKTLAQKQLDQLALQGLQPVKIGSDLFGDIYAIRGKDGQLHRVDPHTGAIMEGAPITPQSSLTTTPSGGVPPPMADAGSGDTSVTLSPKSAGPSPAMATDWKPDTERNDAMLANLPPEQAALIKSIADYRTNPANLSYRDKTKVLAAVQLYDPGYDMTRFNTINKARSAFSGTGVEARNFQSNDMAIKHIGSGLEHIEAMRNYTIFPALNTPINLVKGQLSPQFQQARAELGTDIDAVGNELMRTFRGSGSPSEKEALEWRNKFPINGSPVEQRAAFKEAAELLASRVTAAGNRFNDAMGPNNTRDPISWLSPEGQDVLRFSTSFDPQQPIPKEWRTTPKSTDMGATQRRQVQAIPAPAQREVGQTYDTPKGKAKWTGKGWELVH